MPRIRARRPLAATGINNDGMLRREDFDKLATLADGSSIIPPTRTITAGAGLTGGGDLSANRTIDAAANVDGSIVVNANDIQVGVLATDAQHGLRGGGTQHDDAVPGAPGTSGFMTGADKAKLDSYPATGTLNRAVLGNGAGGYAESTATRQGNIAVGAILAGTAPNVEGEISPVALGQCLMSQGLATLPAWSISPVFGGDIGINLLGANSTVLTSTPTAPRVHTIPDVVNDTLAMLNATQTLAAKTLTDPVLTGAVGVRVGTLATDLVGFYDSVPAAQPLAESDLVPTAAPDYAGANPTAAEEITRNNLIELKINSLLAKLRTLGIIDT